MVKATSVSAVTLGGAGRLETVLDSHVAKLESSVTTMNHYVGTRVLLQAPLPHYYPLIDFVATEPVQ